MTRLPLPGRTKTRLQPWLTPAECAELHRRCIADTIACVDRSRLPLHVFYAEDGCENPYDREQAARLLSLPTGGGVSISPQRGGDLGERMLNAARSVLAVRDAVVILGTDVPDLEPSTLSAAVRGLAEAEIVLGPARDGGYYLLACTEAHPEIFWGIDWGTGRVLSQTVAAANAVGHSCVLIEQRTDIDVWDDLVDFSRRAAAEGRTLRSREYAVELVDSQKKKKEKDG
jgi:hypothetical protein